jgi:hypothetical protein
VRTGSKILVVLETDLALAPAALESKRGMTIIERSSISFFRSDSMSQKAKFKFSAGAVGAVAIGSFAVGALAIGALAIGRLAIGRLKLGSGSLGSLEIGELTVRRLKVQELQVEETLQLPAGQNRELREPA